ncbi:MAG TPA: hypothetical protein VL201_05615 [Patescibacteria group bacterium]|nr:hypothetical protein [Patescibacteria group bacterium]
MKRLKNYFFMIIFSFYCISCGSLYGMSADVKSNKKEVIIFDLDDTLIQVDEWKSYPSIVWKTFALKFFPWNLWTLLTLKSKRVADQYGNKRLPAKDSTAKNPHLAPGGGATSFCFYGLYGNDSEAFQTLVPEVLKITWQNAMFIPGAKTLLDYLEKKEYPIAYATNKDYTSYKHVAETLDKKYQGAFSRYPKLVLVTQPSEEALKKWSDEFAKKKNIPEGFSNLVHEVLAAKEDPLNHIYFANGYEKPEAEYYDRLKELLKSEPTETQITKFVFFDDKKINIENAEKKDIKGYTIKTVADIVAGLEDQKIIDPKRDEALYKQLAKEGIFGFIEQLTYYTKNQTGQKGQPTE